MILLPKQFCLAATILPLSSSVNMKTPWLFLLQVSIMHCLIPWETHGAAYCRINLFVCKYLTAETTCACFNIVAILVMCLVPACQGHYLVASAQSRHGCCISLSLYMALRHELLMMTISWTVYTFEMLIMELTSQQLGTGKWCWVMDRGRQPQQQQQQQQQPKHKGPGLWSLQTAICRLPSR